MSDFDEPAYPCEVTVNVRRREGEPIMNWEPTMNLRFVERRVTTPLDEYTEVEKTVRVLQQQWRKPAFTESGLHFANLYEWRDVPLVREGE